MPPKKRTDQAKRTPSSSPTTSTAQGSADHHHRLRHTGPSVGTRSNVSAAPSKSASVPAPSHPEPTPESTPTSQGSGEKKPIAKVSSLGARTTFTKFLYGILFLVLLLLAWYIYGMVILLERLKEEVGWWGIIVGDSGRMTQWAASERWWFGSDREGRGGRAGPERSKGSDLEGSLNALANALGISPMQVASAVKPLVPQASLTSIVSMSDETGGSEAVKVLFEDTTRNGRDRADATWILKGFEETVGGGMAEESVAEHSMA